MPAMLGEQNNRRIFLGGNELFGPSNMSTVNTLYQWPQPAANGTFIFLSVHSLWQFYNTIETRRSGKGSKQNTVCCMGSGEECFGRQSK